MTKKKVKTEKEDLSKAEEIELATKRARRDLFLEYVPFLILLFFILIIRAFIASPISVSGSSMQPTLEDGDYVLLYKLKMRTKGISRFDVVVLNNEEGILVKRVIGLPGETLKYEVTEENGTLVNSLYIDGKKVEEPFVSDEYKNHTCSYVNKLCDEGVTLGENEYFIMGDNRLVSNDSRVFGAVTKKEIKGIAEVRLFPFNKFGKIDK
ncbi:MAG: signal peptidase I [Bacilli bacterium]|nr:signal peptidase I [Bacilli bacterium]